MTKRDVVFPAGRQALYERNRYSPAVKSNGFLFVSGQVGSREDGSPEPDLEAQVRLAFNNLNAILKAAGCTSGQRRGSGRCGAHLAHGTQSGAREERSQL